MLFSSLLGPKNRVRPGMTLVELIVAILIIAILMAAIVYFIDPLKQIHRFRNHRRLKDVQSIAEAINVYYQDNDTWPSVPSAWSMIGSDSTECNVPCGAGYGLRLVQSPGYIRVPGQAFNFDQTEKFSVSAWINPDPRPATDDPNNIRFTVLMYKVDNGELPGYLIGTMYLKGKTYAIFIVAESTESWIFGTQYIEEKEFTHLVFAYENLDMKIYVNGDPTWNTDQYFTSDELIPGSFANNGDLLIGGMPTLQAFEENDTNPFLGVVDDIRMFDQTLTQEEVQTLYEGRDTQRLPIAQWSFDEGIGGVIDDLIGDNDGVFHEFQGKNWEQNTPGDFPAGGGRTSPICLPLESELSEYLKKIPFDPADPFETDMSGYAVKRNGNFVTVRACWPEGEGQGGDAPYPDLQVSF